MQVAVLDGGASGEREVSLASGLAVRAGLTAAGHAVVQVELAADGTTWIVQGQAVESAQAAMAGPLASVDAFFLALHGGLGEGGGLQGFLDVCGAVHTGSGMAASSLCMDKLSCLRMVEGDLIQRFGQLETPDRLMLVSASQADLDAAMTLAGEGGLAIKPRLGGSSVATQVLGAPIDRQALAAACEEVFALGDQALVERCVVGTEITAGVLEELDGQPVALPLVEIRPKEGRFFDYQEKYSAGGAQEICPATTPTPAQTQVAQAVALRAHQAAGCSGYSRTDFILTPAGQLVFLEINTLPGMTDRSLFPQAAAEAGLDFSALCDRILRLATKPAIPFESLAQGTCK